MRVSLEHLTKRFGPVTAVDDISLEVNDGEFVALLGPSGCGKTTTLLMIAGIYRPTDGYVKFDDRVVSTLAPKDRNIGMVFQSYALYPHMTVWENLVFPMKLKRVPVGEMKERGERVARMLGIDDLLDRKPAQLSGGQQQRVALGRALAKEPGVLLFDEPLSNLDARLRLSMRTEIKRLQMDLGITSIYVTHDQVEAMTMADRVAVIQKGRLQAYCTPDQLYDQPANLFVASFVGNPPMNFLEGSVTVENRAYVFHNHDVTFPVAPQRGEQAAGRPHVTLGIRPEDVTICTGGLAGEVYMVEPLGRDDLVDIQFGREHLHLLADPGQRLHRGDRVEVTVNPARVQFFDPDSKVSLLWPA